MTRDTTPVKHYLKAEALSFVQKGDLVSAVERYREYLVLNPWDDDTWAGLGGAYRRQENINQAIASYEQAYALNPHSSYALINLISLRSARHTAEDQQKLETDIPAAIELCQENISRKHNDYWDWYDLATLQLIQGETDQAISNFHYALELTPKNSAESFKSLFNNLTFLQANNPAIPQIDQVTRLVQTYLPKLGPN